jgi:hypothetical protein
MIGKTSTPSERKTANRANRLLFDFFVKLEFLLLESLLEGCAKNLLKFLE